MDLEELAVALEQIADRVMDVAGKGLKVGSEGRAWRDDSGEVVLVLMDGGLVHTTVAAWREVVLVNDWQAARTTDADHRAHAAKLCRGAAAELRKSATAIEVQREVTSGLGG
jgi:hypothetical protein